MARKMTNNENIAINKNERKNEDDMSIFDIVAGRAAVCLFESEKRRDAKTEDVDTPSSATNWINDASAFALQKAFEKLKLKVSACIQNVRPEKND